MNLETITDPITILSLCTASVSVAIILLLQLRPIITVLKSARQQNTTPIPGSLPDTSVIVYSSGASSKLPALLDVLMTQEYPGEYEVIVVNDGCDPLTDDVLLMAESRWKNLRHTFTPTGTRNLSPRKLALTLGIKAARHDIIVHTTTDAIPTSKSWLARMVAPFNSPDTEIAIGISTINESRQTSGISGGFRTLFSLMDNTIIMTAASRCRAFSGDANNLAYRRDLFFRRQGFSETLDIYYGDDDVFISNATTSTNTAGIISRESIVNVCNDDIKSYYRDLRLRRAFTSSYLHKNARRVFNMSIIMLYVWLFSTISAIISSPTSIIAQSINLLVLLCLWIPLHIYWVHIAKVLNVKTMKAGITYFLFTLPFRKLYYRIRCRAVHRAQINWQSTKH